MPERPITEFFNTDYTQYASYDTYRKLGSYIDGLKVSARKTVYTVLKVKIVDPKKVSQLQSKIAEETQYLHGEQSLFGVIVGLAQNFPCSNNLPILYADGNFGNRLIPVASAGRYIKTSMLPVMNKLFRVEDNPLLVEQEFEGDLIEPRFYVPTIPLMLVNGSEGLATGFAQKILQRNPIDIANHIKKRLKGQKSNYDYIPYYNGFSGKIIHVEDNTYEMHGFLTRINSTTIKITELPPNMSLENYIKHLDKLEDQKKIRSYDDLSNNDRFEFEVRVPREILKSKTDEQLKRIFKLIKTETENITCNDENLVVRKFESPEELLDAYINIKLEYMQKRKDYMIARFDSNISQLKSKLCFIKGVITDTIKIRNVPAIKVEKQLDAEDDIIRINDTYNYLLNMAISSITKERYDQLKKQLKQQKEELALFRKKTIQDLWISDIDELLQTLK